MSFKVVDEVLEVSQSRLAARLVAVTIAEVAYHDGVGFIVQGPEDRRDSIAFRAKVTEKSVSRATAELEELDELEVLWVQKKRRRFKLYRLIVGRIRDLPVAYDRLEQYLGVSTETLARPFWTASELALPRVDRPGITTGQIVGSSNARDGQTSCPPRPDILSPDDPTECQVAYKEHGPETTSEDLSLTESLSNESDSVAAGAAAEASSIDPCKLLVRAFAEELGRWPDGREEWGAWMKAFAGLAAKGVDDEELRRAVRAARRRWPSFDLENPFAIAKLWQTIEASLERSYFALRQWATATSWKLPADEAEWILDHARDEGRLSVDEHAKLTKLATEERSIRSSAEANLLRWVELQGWAVDESDYRHELELRGGAIDPKRRRDAIAAASARRRELRQELAQLALGLPSEERAA